MSSYSHERINRLAKVAERPLPSMWVPRPIDHGIKCHCGLTTAHFATRNEFRKHRAICQ